MSEPSREPFHERRPEAPVDRLFVERWSPRAFDARPVPRETLHTLFEAARWAPSCYNEQPWRFVFADAEPELSTFKSALVEANRVWNATVPVLAFLLTRPDFARNGKPNFWAELDAGAAWMSLALQARRLGLITHAMAGFDRARVHEVANAPEESWRVMCGIAIGHPGDPSGLPEKLREREVPSPRKALSEVANAGPLRD